MMTIRMLSMALTVHFLVLSAPLFGWGLDGMTPQEETAAQSSDSANSASGADSSQAISGLASGDSSAPSAFGIEKVGASRTTTSVDEPCNCTMTNAAVCRDSQGAFVSAPDFRGQHC